MLDSHLECNARGIIKSVHLRKAKLYHLRGDQGVIKQPQAGVVTHFILHSAPEGPTCTDVAVGRGAFRHRPCILNCRLNEKRTEAII